MLALCSLLFYTVHCTRNLTTHRRWVACDFPRFFLFYFFQQLSSISEDRASFGKYADVIVGSLHRKSSLFQLERIAMKCFIALFLAFATVANAFAPSSRMVTKRVAPLNENFGFDFGTCTLLFFFPYVVVTSHVTPFFISYICIYCS